MGSELAAEFLGTLWLVLGGCGSAALAAKFSEVAQLWLFWVASIAGAAVAGLVHAWLGAEDSAADRDRSAREAALAPREALAPATAREPR